MPASKKQNYARYTLAALERLGELVAITRKEQRMTAQDLADRIGVGRGIIHRLEMGNPKIDIGVAFEACTILAIPLLDEEDAVTMTPRNDDGGKRLALLPRYARARAVELSDDF